jgi:hypothetical protein
MDGRWRFLSSWFLAAVLVGSLTITACGHRDERVYDPDHRDYHTWNRDEVAHYNQWAAENHREPNRDFRRLPPEEQREYWTWRHSH